MVDRRFFGVMKIRFFRRVNRVRTRYLFDFQPKKNTIFVKAIIFYSLFS